MIAEKEYKRLIKIYKDAGADEGKLQANDRLIKKVAELFAILEAMKDSPTLIFSKKNPANILETAAGKARVKYLAQYVNAMTKLNRDLLGGADNFDDGLDEFND